MTTASNQSTSRDWPHTIDKVTRALGALGDALAHDGDFRSLIGHVCDQVKRAVADVDQASVTVLRDGESETVAATSRDIVRLDASQHDSGAGPCIEAARTGQLVRVKIDDAEPRWPQFIAEARALGVGSFLSAPLTIDQQFSGAINCYSFHDHGFAELDAHLLELYTTAVEIALCSYQRYLRARELADQLRTALQTRAVIDQAKGILMAAHGITADEAFAVLVEQSQRDNSKVRDLAEQFVTNVTRTK